MGLKTTAVRALLAGACFTTAFTAGTVGADAAIPHAAAIPPGTVACEAAYHFHHVNAVEALYGDEEVWQGTYAAALHTAREASQAVAGPVVHWLYEGTGWSAVRAACVPYMSKR